MLLHSSMAQTLDQTDTVITQDREEKMRISTPVLDMRALADLNSIIPELATKKVVFVGETHDSFAHHLNQLEIIRCLYQVNPNLTIGMEFFQQPFQRYLDAYISGELDEREMLTKTEYYDRWRYDFRHYAPILRFAREKSIPVLALNIPSEITRKVSRYGLESLNKKEQAMIPKEIDRTSERYRDRIYAIFKQHPAEEGASFENFLQAQLLWDEGMAERAAQYLRGRQDGCLVVLAGAGHLVYGEGIPNRLKRRISAETAIILNGAEYAIQADIADFLLLPSERSLPPAGTLGVLLKQVNGGLHVDSFSEGSAAVAAGIKQGDRIVAINGSPIRVMTDLRVQMWDKRPGASVAVKVRRKPWLSEEKTLAFEVELR